MTYTARMARNRSRGQASGMLVLLTLFLASIAGIAWIAFSMVAPDRWPIRWLEVNGEFQRISAEQLRASLSTGMNDSYFTVDIGALEAAARRNAWVSSVRVQKIWPDTVAVTVREYQPVAHWNSGTLVSSDGMPFSVPEADELQGLPWLKGPEGRLDDVLTVWAGIDEALLPLGLEVERLTLDDRGSWSMQLDNGTKVFLGRDSMEERLDRLLSGWEPLMEQQDVPPQGIDLRYTNGFAVAWPVNGEQNNG